MQTKHFETPDNIWCWRENHPELIVNDLKEYCPPDIIRYSLKYRGVNKWLRVRRLLIQLKHRWKRDIGIYQEQKQLLKQNGDMIKYYKLVGYVEALMDCRQQVRALCHSPRDIDFPLDHHEFGDICILPDNFPKRPHKRWFWTHKAQSETDDNDSKPEA